MARRIDYYDDPSAPAANALIRSVNVVVVNDAGGILLIHRSDNDHWTVPGRAIDLGESVAQAAIRETREEPGITCELTGLVGICFDPRHVVPLHQRRRGPPGALDRADRAPGLRDASA